MDSRRRVVLTSLLRRARAFVFLTSLCAASTRLNAAPTVVVKSGDASIAQDAAAATWVVTAGGSVLTLGLDPSRDFQVLTLATGSGKTWMVAPAADTLLS